MRFGTCYGMSLCKVADKSVAGKFVKYKLDLVEVQELLWEREGYQMVDNYTVFLWKREC
jgi:hypothetical protein